LEQYEVESTNTVKQSVLKGKLSRVTSDNPQCEFFHKTELYFWLVGNELGDLKAGKADVCLIREG
jgi:hypothetical protein